jgi:hypothetical protein
MQPATTDHHSVSLVDIGEDIDLLLPDTIYLASPYEMGAAQLAPFQAGRKDIILIDHMNRRAVPASVQKLSETTLIARTPHARYFETQRRQELMVAFPFLPQQEYIMRMRIDDVAQETLTLRYQDNRAGKRWSYPILVPVILHLAPSTLMAVARYAHTVREILTLQEDSLSGRVQQVSDMFCEFSLSQKPLMAAFESAPTLSCQLRDISRGGISVLLAGAYRLDELESCLVQCHLQLPASPDLSAARDDISLTLRLLGVVRHVRTQVDPWSVHIQFLSPLPEEVAPSFKVFSQG